MKQLKTWYNAQWYITFFTKVDRLSANPWPHRPTHFTVGFVFLISVFLYEVPFLQSNVLIWHNRTFVHNPSVKVLEKPIDNVFTKGNHVPLFYYVSRLSIYNVCVNQGRLHNTVVYSVIPLLTFMWVRICPQVVGRRRQHPPCFDCNFVQSLVFRLLECRLRVFLTECFYL